MGKAFFLFCCLWVSAAQAADDMADCASEPYFSRTEQETKCMERMRLLMETQDLRGQLVRALGTPKEFEVRVRLDRAETELMRTPCSLTKAESERNCVAVNRSKAQKTRLPASVGKSEGSHESAPAR